MPESSRSNVQIRYATPDDAAAIAECVRRAYQPYFAGMDTEPAPMLDDYPALVASGVVRVATVDDVIRGAIVMWPKPDHFYIDNVAVDPSSQGQGIGNALLNDADRAAIEADRSEIRLYTNEAMTENLTFYPRRGYVQTHEAQEHGYNRVYFKKSISDRKDQARH